MVLGMNEIVIIVLFIVLLLVGSKKIPELARAFGRAMGEFKRGKMEIERELAQQAQQKSGGTAAPRTDLYRAAEALGIDPSGKSEAQLREEIAYRARGA
ncbi:MAG TPA: twin-arginine translocase TatA/TatE family subunit [Thermoplasmata archaeon]|nr:twin-arginine translocase TatA/TatE family subunit [Thermoplasmata archaeon]